MATHSSIFPWRLSWTEEPGGLQSMTGWLNMLNNGCGCELVILQDALIFLNSQTSMWKNRVLNTNYLPPNMVVI